MSEGTVDMNTRACPRCGGLLVHAKDCETETVKALKQQAAEAYARGVADERARVVAFLKDKTSEKRLNDWYTRLLSAEEIQRGEHEEAKWDSAHELDEVIRLSPLTATPLADELRDEREVSQSLREQLIAAEAERDAWKEHAGKVEAEMVRHKAARDQILLGVEAERDEWRRQLRDTERYSAEQEMAHADLTAELAMVRAAGQELTMEFEGVEAERDALRAQVADWDRRKNDRSGQPYTREEWNLDPAEGRWNPTRVRPTVELLFAQVEAAREGLNHIANGYDDGVMPTLWSSREAQGHAQETLAAMDGAKP